MASRLPGPSSRFATGAATFARLSLAALAALCAAALLARPASAAGACAWPDWDAFKRNTISADGRVVDASTPQKVTVSEGQAYALFFALVANDRPTFDKLLNWTENNLSQGDIAGHLPAWIWGSRQEKDKPESWGVIDSNSATDADLWIAYTLLEAGLLWQERRFTALGTLIARRIANEETASLQGLGPTVLPGPQGFRTGPGQWRLNPSYVPLQLMRRLAVLLADDPAWAELLDSSVAVVTQSAPKGYAPDWVLHDDKRGFLPDEQSHAESAYNAIRVYLWAGMMDPRDPLRPRVLQTFRPLADFVAAHGHPPERVDTRSGEPGPNAGNAGFSAAVAPYLDALGQPELARAQVRRTHELAAAEPLGYYSQVLALFGLGYLDGQFRFNADGALAPAWKTACPAR